MDVRIIRVGPGDAALLDRVDDDIFDHVIDPGLLADYLNAPGHLMVVAVADGRVVGQARAILTRQPDAPLSLYVDNLGVAEARRREGIAGRLLDELVAWGQTQGCAVAWVATETDNGPARAFYQGRGATEDLIAYYTYEIDAK